MRERANKIEQLKEQLKMYEASSSSNLISTRDEEDSRQQSSSPTIPAANNRNVGCWVPLYETTLPVGANEEWCQLSLLGNSQLTCVQEQVSPGHMKQQSANSSGGTQQQLERWAPAGSQRTITRAQLHTPSLMIEGEVSSSGSSILPLNAVDFSANLYEGQGFDMTEPLDESTHSMSFLHMAAAGNHIDTVKVLLQDKRIKVDAVDSGGFTPLQRAIVHEKSEIVKLLLEKSTVGESGTNS